RIRSAEVLGRANQQLGTHHYLTTLIEDNNPAVVETAVFFMGLVGNKDAAVPVSQCLSNKPTYIKMRALEALGRIKPENGLQLITPFLTNFHASLRAQAALALAQLGNSKAGTKLVNSLLDPDPQVVSCAAYALGRLECKKFSEDILLLLRQNNPEIKLRSTEALGRLKYERAIPAISKLLTNSDRMISIKAAEALSRISNKNCIEPLEDLLNSSDSYLKTVALGGLGAISDDNSFSEIIELLDDNSEMVRIAALKAAALTDGKKTRKHLLRVIKYGTPIEKMTAAEFLGETEISNDLTLLTRTLLSDSIMLMREGAAKGIGRWQKKNELNKEININGEKITPIGALLKTANCDDPILASIAIESLEKSAAQNKIDDLILIFTNHNGRAEGDRKLAILTAVSKLYPGEPEPIVKGQLIYLLKTALKETDPRVPKKAQKIANNLNISLSYDAKRATLWKRGKQPWDNPALPSGKRGIRVTTKRGKIDILLYGDDAPNIVKSIITLANDGFYDGLTFHRVVPGFVIQGGCPRGDGWGDAGYFLRSEFNLHKYQRGTVGMAHSGKDTAGSQIFITQTAQYHLDGLYTIIGKVTKGMDIVDKIEVGDKFNISVIQ
ncbi:peptidylprolyl isomerase, partial [bacterium]|nr:peptidylprolyl isomerase [bacterium]